MPFPELIKSRVREKAHFRCCLCRKLGVEVHHIIPEQRGGPSTEENAAPLCPTCHELYGDNPRKRKFIKEARDFWYRLCAEGTDVSSKQFEKMMKALKATATKQDIADLKEIMASRGKISPDIYNKSVCIKQIGIQCNREMKLEEIVTFLYLRCYSDNRIRSSEITRSFCNVFLSNKFWPKGEDRDIRDNFLRRFGTDTAEKLCAYLLDISGVKWFSSFTEDDFGMIMSDFRTTVILLSFSVAFDPIYGFLSLRINEESEFIYEKMKEI